MSDIYLTIKMQLVEQMQALGTTVDMRDLDGMVKELVQRNHDAMVEAINDYENVDK